MSASRLALLIVWLGACSSSSAIGPDGGVGVDAAPGTPDAASPAADAGPIAYVCAETLDAYCASGSGCVRRFSDLPKCGPRFTVRQCDSLQAFAELGVDTSRTSYYDASGDLVAVIVFQQMMTRCAGGPQSFVAPVCGDPTFLPPCSGP